MLDVALTTDASETKAGRPGGQDGQRTGYVGVRPLPPSWRNGSTLKAGWQSGGTGSGWTYGSAACLIAALTCQDSREDSTHILVCGQPSFSYDQPRHKNTVSLYPNPSAAAAVVDDADDGGSDGMMSLSSSMSPSLSSYRHHHRRHRRHPAATCNITVASVVVIACTGSIFGLGGLGSRA